MVDFVNVIYSHLSFIHLFLINHSNYLSLTAVPLCFRLPRLAPTLCRWKRTFCMSVVTKVCVNGFTQVIAAVFKNPRTHDLSTLINLVD